MLELLVLGSAVTLCCLFSLFFPQEIKIKFSVSFTVSEFRTQTRLTVTGMKHLHISGYTTGGRLLTCTVCAYSPAPTWEDITLGIEK